MSAATPTASTPDASTPAPIPTETSQGTLAADRLVLEYLRARGHKSAEQALTDTLGSSDDKGKSPATISGDELVKKLTVFAEKPAQPGENTLKTTLGVQKELASAVNSSNLQNLIASIGPVGAEEILSLDPNDKQEGFRELEAWPEFRHIIFPIFCHFYLDLVQFGFKDAAQEFFETFSPSLEPLHITIIHRLSTLRLPSHIQSDETAQQFRNEKYTIRMSRSGFALLLGWLTEGIGGEAPGAGDGFFGEKGRRGRAAVMRVVNNHLRFDVSPTNATKPSTSYEDSTAFNDAAGELKLGPAPISDELRTETEKSSHQYDNHLVRASTTAGMVSPTTADLLPHPPTFKTVDVRREVEKVRDARKRIRLDPSAHSSTDGNTSQGVAARQRSLPSICASPCCAFSEDTYIRLWNLKGEPLNGLQSEFQLNNIRDSSSLTTLREKGGAPTRKLIGHSGPVYSLTFDPVSGSAAPPKYLLSGSADATARLWSMDTMTNVVAYRGHQNPIWDSRSYCRLWSTDRTSTLRIYAGHSSDVDQCVRFHPNSLYIATGSSDWSARLWDVQRGTSVRVFIGHQGVISTLAFSPDGRYLATAGEDLAVNIWDLGSGRRVKKMTAESTVLVSGGADWTVRCWDVKSAGGPPETTRTNGATTNGTGTHNSKDLGPDVIETTDLLSTFPTKRTPITTVHFTPRNLCLVAGPHLSMTPR
ncbi:TFIID and SAGA subunit [Lactarius pseudohatsudake]|nr:TFIID and SAGA subunit [Lactarius pseudohatsudake]